MIKSKIKALKEQQSEIKRILDDTEKLLSTDEPLKRIERINQCKICLEHGKFENIMIARKCGHAGFCNVCVDNGKLIKCPVCRSDTTFVKLFI